MEEQSYHCSSTHTSEPPYDIFLFLSAARAESANQITPTLRKRPVRTVRPVDGTDREHSGRRIVRNASLIAAIHSRVSFNDAMAKLDGRRPAGFGRSVSLSILRAQLRKTIRLRPQHKHWCQRESATLHPDWHASRALVGRSSMVLFQGGTIIIHNTKAKSNEAPSKILQTKQQQGQA